MRPRITKPIYTTRMKAFRTIVKFTSKGVEHKKSFSGQLSEEKALQRVKEEHPEVTELSFFYHDEL